MSCDGVEILGLREMPSIVSPFILIAVYVAIITLALYMTYTTSDYSKFEGGRLRIFLAVVGGLGTLVTFLFYYNLVQIQNTQAERDMDAGRVALDKRLSDYLVDEVKDATPIVPTFVRSLSRLTCELDPPIPEGIDEYTLEAMAMKLALSSKIFYTWDAFISDRRSSGQEWSNAYVYLAAFLQQACSAPLEEYWRELNPTMRLQTRKLGGLLFARAKTIGQLGGEISSGGTDHARGACAMMPNSKSFIKAAQDLAQDPEYIALIRPKRSFFANKAEDLI